VGSLQFNCFENSSKSNRLFSISGRLGLNGSSRSAHCRAHASHRSFSPPMLRDPWCVLQRDGKSRARSRPTPAHTVLPAGYNWGAVPRGSSYPFGAN
jgi:hypothetical protein